MSEPTLPKTLLQMAGANLAPATWAESALILIDCQNEYLDGMLPLTGVVPALDQCALLLAGARKAGAPVFHIRHKGKAGSAFDWDARGGAIADAVAPDEAEAVVAKGLPNSFAGTELADLVKASGRPKLVVAGFMTHMCVSTTTRAALDLGYFSTVVAGACATRDLPDGHGGVVKAADLHRAELAALSDRFCVVAPDAGTIA
jgi:nicotinamidase-related amidase